MMGKTSGRGNRAEHHRSSDVIHKPSLLLEVSRDLVLSFAAGSTERRQTPLTLFAVHHDNSMSAQENPTQTTQQFLPWLLLKAPFTGSSIPQSCCCKGVSVWEIQRKHSGVESRDSRLKYPAQSTGCRHCLKVEQLIMGCREEAPYKGKKQRQKRPSALDHRRSRRECI